MMRYLILSLVLFTMISCKELEILKYEYHTSTQMGRTVLAVTKDSVTVTFNGRGEPTYWARAVKAEEWKAINQSMQDVKLNEVSTLPAPSNGRATDRSPYAKFKFVGKDSTLTSSDFDAGKPHEMLQPLMQVFNDFQSTISKD